LIGTNTYIFRGGVLPADLPLTLAYEPQVERKGAQESPDERINASIKESEIVVRVDVAVNDADLHDILYSDAYDVVRTMTDVASLSDGVAYIPYLDEVTLPSGEIVRLALADRTLATCCAHFNAHNSEAIIDLAICDIHLARALADVSVMLSWPHYAPIAAGRVIDTIVRMLTGGRSTADWEAARATINVDRAYLQRLSDEATPARHGDRRYVAGKDVRILAERAWTVMDRYLALRLQNATSLDPNLFPLLEG
jgi:hypothetical protein